MSVGIDWMPNEAAKLLLGLGVDLGEHEVGIGLRRLLEHRTELTARAAPRRPEVDQHGVVARDGLLRSSSVVISTVAMRGCFSRFV